MLLARVRGAWVLGDPVLDPSYICARKRLGQCLLSRSDNGHGTPRYPIWSFSLSVWYEKKSSTYSYFFQASMATNLIIGKGFRRGSMLPAWVGGARAPADPVLDASYICVRKDLGQSLFSRSDNWHGTPPYPRPELLLMSLIRNKMKQAWVVD